MFNMSTSRLYQFFLPSKSFTCFSFTITSSFNRIIIRIYCFCSIMHTFKCI
nr:MAG TPA: hypothetical protein [Caudoviricetes sp.]